jgi:hypothetical protein
MRNHFTASMRGAGLIVRHCHQTQSGGPEDSGRGNLDSSNATLLIRVVIIEPSAVSETLVNSMGR